ncbi:unnamed protein product [Linum trigynum]|uniref:Uncharacterized protein n=1 Tax=Linum trigynum TaxID=586398 RepID=A0AAV2G6H7_9ROSI
MFEMSKTKFTTKDGVVAFRFSMITRSMNYDKFIDAIHILPDVDAQTLVEKATPSINFEAFFKKLSINPLIR